MSDGVRKLDNGSWNARYVGPDGRRYSRTFRVKRDATTWRGQELRLIDLDDCLPRRAPRRRYTRAGSRTRDHDGHRDQCLPRRCRPQMARGPAAVTALRYQTATALRDAERARCVSDAWNL